MSQEPFTYRRDDSRRYVRVTARRLLSADEIVGIVNLLIDEGVWTYRILWDWRQVTQTLAPDEVGRVAAHVAECMQELGPGGPMAFVTRTPTIIGSIQHYSNVLRREPIRVGTFWDVEEAEGWLEQQPAS